MISFPLKAQRWPPLVFLSVCVTATESRETATCLISRRCERAKAVAFYWEEHLHIQLCWELIRHCLLSISEPLFNCMQCQCLVNLSLWIISSFFKALLHEPWLFLFCSILSVCALNIGHPHHQILSHVKVAWVEQTSVALLTCFAAVQINKFSKVDANLLYN